MEPFYDNVKAEKEPKYLGQFKFFQYQFVSKKWKKSIFQLLLWNQHLLDPYEKSLLGQILMDNLL